MADAQTFPANYIARVVELPPTGGVEKEFVAKNADGRALTVRIEPANGLAWTASFASPIPGVRALSGMFATPSPESLCVVERGTAFAGDVRTGVGFDTPLDISPVVEVTPLVSVGLLLLQSPWEIAGLDSRGTRWISRRIAVDGFRVLGLRDGQIVGVADTQIEARSFSVNARTGEVSGAPDLPGD